MPKSRLKLIRERMWRKNPRCAYCGIITVLPSSPLLHRDKTGKIRYFPNNMATIDHLRSRLDPLRQINIGEKRYILVCNKCNNERGKREIESLELGKLWELSNRKPIAMRLQDAEFIKEIYGNENRDSDHGD